MNSDHERVSDLHHDEHISINPTVLYIGTPVALITTLNIDGTTNISPMSSSWALFDRVVLGMSSTSKGREKRYSRTRAGDQFSILTYGQRSRRSRV